MGNIWNLTIQLIEIIFLFGLVLVLAYLSTRFLGRRLTNFGSSRQMRLLDQLPLGSNRSVFLLEVKGRVFLVGSAEGGISLLSIFDDPETARAIIESTEAQNSGLKSFGGLSLFDPGAFKNKLEEFLSRNESARPVNPEEGEELPLVIQDSLRKLRELKRNGDRND